MAKPLLIGLVGDRDTRVPAHRAIPLALRDAGERLGVLVQGEWLPTESIAAGTDLTGLHGLWCVPASPYRSLQGALLAIHHARVQAVPFLGTCGGFQHAVLEYAREVLGWQDATHGELSPEGPRVIISPLQCALLETTAVIRLQPGTRIASAYGSESATEGYHCRFGIDARFRAALLRGPLQATAHDEQGEVRAVELEGHPFFVATLFQPERAALRGQEAPLVSAFVAACAADLQGRSA